jgi:pilus assembly protein Flp/PilA
MFKLLKKLRRDEDGATAIEYGLIAALIAVAAIVAMTALGTSLSGIMTYIGGQLDSAAGTAVGGGDTSSP